VGLFRLPDFTQITNPKVWMVALTIMTVASIETLLCIEAIDKLDPQKRTTSANTELKAQGIGNMISGLLGGLPLTSVIVRSSANLNAGAKTKMSAIIHGLLILVCSAFIPMLLNKIPLASLAAILLMTGYKLAKISVFKEMFAKSKYQWMPFIITVLVVVFTDLLTGVLVGLAVSIFAILRGNIKNTYFFHKQEHKEGETIYIHLSEEVSFLNKAAIKLTLEHLPENSTVVIDASHCHYIDHDVIELIKEFTSEKSKLKKIDCKTIGFLSDYAIENSSNIKSFTTNKLEHRETILKQFQTTN
jgi:carbonic anhydrase